ncbi:MAG: PQQ-binding-like beta-propeller repeat protein [Pirellulales bacterium]
MDALKSYSLVHWDATTYPQITIADRKLLMDPTENSTSNAAPRVGARRKWFPVLVIVVAAAWWFRQSTISQYQTLAHAIVVLVSILLVTAWYLSDGGQPRRVRRWIVWPIWFALVGFLIVFKPVYNGDMGVYKWRLRFASSEDQRMASLEAAGRADDWQTTPHDYPRFLGNGYWAEVKGVDLETDWKAHPPKEVWRREIGAGWSAFAIVGNYAVTQEQRGPLEMVTCYRVDTGEPVWSHSDEARFDPINPAGGLGDIGPRATPTLHNGRVFTQGGTGIVNCLDARTGEVLWSHDTVEEFGATVPLWGKSGSPLVVDDKVVISVGTTGDESIPDSFNNSSLVAFDINTGKVRWAAGQRQASYASPILADLAGERQIVVVNESYVTAHRARDGKQLWEHVWTTADDRNASCSQPVPLPRDRVFLSKGYGSGASLLAIQQDAKGQLAAEPLWNPPIKRVMKTKFCNVVLRDGYVYGLDDILLSCIELETGKLKWKKRRDPPFGHGQILLIGDVILVLSETGELALVEASPERYRELASLQALDEANVTWNNPAYSPPYLLVRNAREAACYRLPTK